MRTWIVPYMLLAVSLCVTGCAAKKPEFIYGTYEYQPLGFSLRIPDEWRAELIDEEEPTPRHASLKITDPDNEAVILFTATRTEMSPKQAAFMDIDQYRADSRKRLTPIIQEPWETDGLKGYFVENTLECLDMSLFQRRVYIDNYPVLYVVILQAPEKELAEIYMPYFDEIIDSLELSLVKE
ncbi:MAG: hypothetical protein AB1454_03300 [Candidatus Auribacterota bacterium]